MNHTSQGWVSFMCPYQISTHTPMVIAQILPNTFTSSLGKTEQSRWCCLVSICFPKYLIHFSLPTHTVWLRLKNTSVALCYDLDPLEYHFLKKMRVPVLSLEFQWSIWKDWRCTKAHPLHWDLHGGDGSGHLMKIHNIEWDNEKNLHTDIKKDECDRTQTHFEDLQLLQRDLFTGDWVAIAQCDDLQDGANICMGQRSMRFNHTDTNRTSTIKFKNTLRKETPLDFTCADEHDVVRAVLGQRAVHGDVCEFVGCGSA